MWRGDPSVATERAQPSGRMRPVFDALADAGLQPIGVVYSDGAASDVYRQLLQLRAVLVWVDPISAGQDRSTLDGMLRDVAARGVWVSAHPDTIMKMGTKEVLFATRNLGWGSDVRLYRSFGDFKREFPASIVEAGPRVLKRHRGNGGIGVWKVELAPAADVTTTDGDVAVIVQDAEHRDEITRSVPLAAFIDELREHVSDDDPLIDQIFEPRIVDGMVRCYMVENTVAGFALQSPSPAGPSDGSSRRVFGLPSAKTMFPETEPRFQAVRSNMESAWVPGMQEMLALDREALPVLWDADFLFGPKTNDGEDTYVLCEINVSCVTPFPDAVPSRLALSVANRLRSAAAN